MKALQQGCSFGHGAGLRPALGLPLLDARKGDVVHEAAATYGIAHEQAAGSGEYFGAGTQRHPAQCIERYEAAPGDETAKAGCRGAEELRAHERLQAIGGNHGRRNEFVAVRRGVFEDEA